MAVRSTASLLTRKPTSRDLSKFCLVHHIKWYVLGIELEVDQEELEKIEEKYSDDHVRLIKMFGTWLRTSNSPTYRTLLKALIDIGKRNTAESLCQKLGELTHITYKYCVLGMPNIKYKYFAV